MEFGFEITGDRQVGLRFERFPRDAHDELLARIENITVRLEAMVLAAEPRPRTGELAASTSTRIDDKPTRISGRVMMTRDFAKAAALEYGAHGVAHLREHQARLNHVFARLIEPMIVTIAAHSRQADILEHRYLRGPLAEMDAAILAELEAALEEAAAK